MKQEVLLSWKQRFVSWLIILGLLGVLSLVLVSCAYAQVGKVVSNNNSIGKATGHRLDNTIVTVLTDATVGGVMGTMINRQMDRQASELRTKLKGAKVVRFEEGILITIDSRLLFEADSYRIESTKGILRDVARALGKYDFTNAVIEGHTANVGEEIYNQSLSEHRAYEIEKYLISEGIKDARIRTRGYGERQPIASNDTESGRQLNCRIEIALYASEELRSSTTAADVTYTALKQ